MLSRGILTSFRFSSITLQNGSSSILANTFNKAAACSVPQLWAAGVPNRAFNIAKIDMPKPDDKKYPYRFIVKYPKDGKYTTEHLEVQRCGGRNPLTGRCVVGTWGNGRRTKYRWIDFNRNGPTEENVFKEERVIEVQYDPNRTPFIALVGSGTHLRYILATSQMKAGDLIRSSSYIPEIPGRGKPGDSFPMGALAVGTEVCHVEKFPGDGAAFLMAAGVSGKVSRRLPDGKVILLLKNKAEFALDATCNAVVGRISNIDYNKVHIGSGKRLRWLGYRPRSGLKQRKDGYAGRKIRPPPPIKYSTTETKNHVVIELKCDGEGSRKLIIPKTDRVT